MSSKLRMFQVNLRIEMSYNQDRDCFAYSAADAMTPIKALRSLTRPSGWCAYFSSSSLWSSSNWALALLSASAKSSTRCLYLMKSI